MQALEEVLEGPLIKGFVSKVEVSIIIFNLDQSKYVNVNIGHFIHSKKWFLKSRKLFLNQENVSCAKKTFLVSRNIFLVQELFFLQ